MIKLERALKGILQALSLLVVTFAIFGILGLQLMKDSEACKKNCEFSHDTFLKSYFTFFIVSIQDPTWPQEMLRASENAYDPNLRSPSTKYLVFFAYMANIFISRYLVGSLVTASILKQFLRDPPTHKN